MPKLPGIRSNNICGDLHASTCCNKKKYKASAENCSNCGGDHTANYSGYPVHKALKERKNIPQTNLNKVKVPAFKPQIINYNQNSKPQTQILCSSTKK